MLDEFGFEFGVAIHRTSQKNKIDVKNWWFWLRTKWFEVICLNFKVIDIHRWTLNDFGGILVDILAWVKKDQVPEKKLKRLVRK